MVMDVEHSLSITTDDLHTPWAGLKKSVFDATNNAIAFPHEFYDRLTLEVCVCIKFRSGKNALKNFVTGSCVD